MSVINCVRWQWLMCWRHIYNSMLMFYMIRDQSLANDNYFLATQSQEMQQCMNKLQEYFHKNLIFFIVSTTLDWLIFWSWWRQSNKSTDQRRIFARHLIQTQDNLRRSSQSSESSAHLKKGFHCRSASYFEGITLFVTHFQRGVSVFATSYLMWK